MVKPIAMQDVLARTPIAERVNQLQKAAPETDQRHAVEVVRNLHIQKQKETVPLEQTDEAIIHREKPKQDQPQDRRKKNNDENKNEHKDSGVDLTA